ncbi:MAG: ABC transporter substrate-binding protein [Rhodospirillaceae bacterium]|nr:ABC transporter substrate-binding protein [Rhodospirillaceae bacterium]
MTMRLLAACAAFAVPFAAGIAAAQEVRGVTATEIRLGTEDDLSGPIVFWGQPMRNGKIMRVEEQNAKGGVHGRKIVLIGEDNGYDPKKGVLAAQKLIQQDKVFAVVGVLGTPIALATMPIVLEAGVPFMYPGTNHPGAYEPFNKLKFSMAAPYDIQMKAAVKYMIENKGRKKIAILYQDDEFGKSLREAAEAEAKAMKIPVVSVTSYKRGDTAFSSQVARMRQAGPDLVVAATVVRETAGLGLELKKIGWKVDVLTSAAACNGAVPAIGKDAVEGFYIQCQYVPFDPAGESEAVKDWMKRYQARFGKAANVSAAIGYDMMELTILGLERAGKDLTVAKFVAASETIKNWQNIFGSPPMTFGPDRRLGTKAFVLTQITGGKFKRVTGTLGE